MKRIHSNDLKNVDTYDETNWTSKNFVLQLQSDVQEDPIVTEPFDSKNVFFCKKIPKPSQYIISSDKYKNLISVKNQIDEIPTEKKFTWNKWVHLLNPYEKIGAFSSIDTQTITSRAFYKLYELLMFYNFTLPATPVSLHLCEAPGGFISAMKYVHKNVDWYAHTLYSGTDSLKIDNSLYDENRWLARKTGGNLYHLETIITLRDEFQKKADFITADGGFDVSYDANNQEQLSFKLLYAQFITALHTQQQGGIFILKIFDTLTRPSYQLICLFCKYYKTVEIIKPRTSRSSNSEKYIVAIGFRGISQSELCELENVLVTWNEEGCDESNLEVYCKNLGFPKQYKVSYMEKLKNYNDFLAVNQSWYIHKSICCLKYFDKQKRETSQFNPHNLEALQNKRALEFCIAFGLRSGIENCSHIRATKIEHEEIKNVVRCNRCMKLLINER